MNMENQLKTQKKRKLMLMLPVLVLPFVTLIFWALGGGKSNEAQASENKMAGFNHKLPDSKVGEETELDKMGYYAKAKKDSIKFQEMLRNDPNYSETVPMAAQGPNLQGHPMGSNGMNSSLYGNGYNDPNTQKIYDRLSMLNRELNRPTATNAYQEPYPSGNRTNSTLASSEVDRLEQMMNMMSQPEGDDPEMRQLNGMLEKILDIQHPDRVRQKLKEGSDAKRGQVYAVTGVQKETNVTMLAGSKFLASGGFYALEENTDVPEQNAIQAAVNENQTIVTGSTVKLRLLNEIVVNGTVIPKDNFVFGKASLDGERLTIKIANIRYRNSLYPVELAVFDLDGLDGIRIPGAITRDVAKQSVDRSLQAIGMTSLDPSMEAQAAGAGIEAVKSLVSKKVKLVKVMVKAGYKVLLRDEKQKQSY
ncbi:conjugative transposon protein TraM [Flavobacterium lindanitolerans]|uniref:conjugative transposon protein TraM n=1 Tax=Flavobacterium lindanitolerans TaxID=428988 RepID=UPI0023F038AD|nr:conjugative transposon protein TraM [Flavobacterium lindanitolerans]